MRSAFRKYLALYVSGIAVLVIVAVTVLIQTFQPTNSLAQSLFNIISNWTATLKIFSFIVDWAMTLSVFAVCLVLIALFANFRKQRRSHALRRLHDWAQNAVVILADYRQRDSGIQNSPSERYETIRVLSYRLKANSRTALSDAQVLGGELGADTKKTFHTLSTIEEKLEKHDESAFEDLRGLQHNLADIMISAFDSLRYERDIGLFATKKQVKITKKDT